MREINAILFKVEIRTGGKSVKWFNLHNPLQRNTKSRNHEKERKRTHRKGVALKGISATQSDDKINEKKTIKAPKVLSIMKATAVSNAEQNY